MISRDYLTVFYVKSVNQESWMHSCSILFSALSGL